MQLTIAHTQEELQQSLAQYAMNGKRVALVPTMGALHAGHISLVETAKTHADVVMASIFVNPKQFGKGEDFNTYPRTLDEDIQKLEAAGVALLYVPDEADIYPAGFSTSISAGALANVLDGTFRPGHFSGVATVVTKLFLRTLPHVALFGEKDYQQLAIIRRVTEDLDIPVDIIGVPTLREADGLAMSSRNVYLNSVERKKAPALYRALQQTAVRIGNHVSVKDALADGVSTLAAEGFKVDYLELCDVETLQAQTQFGAPARLLVAAWLGKTRLIDNFAME